MKHKGDTGKLEEATQGLGVLMSAYDWIEAMKYAKFKFQDIEEVILAEEGENDERDWKLLVKLKNGKFGVLIAGCDYSGWDCQSDGNSWEFDEIEDAQERIKKGRWEIGG